MAPRQVRDQSRVDVRPPIVVRAPPNACSNQPSAERSLLGAILEVAGKFLIFVDAARLGRPSQRKLRDQLKRAGDHLAKGLYAKATEIRPADFKELLGFLEPERATLYLDGPNDVDSIFRNEILSSRGEYRGGATGVRSMYPLL